MRPVANPCRSLTSHVFEQPRRGDRPRPLQLAAEGAVLEHGEQRVEFGERGAVRGFQCFDGGDAVGKFALQWKMRTEYGVRCRPCMQ